MTLVKYHGLNDDFLEDFGIFDGNSVTLVESKDKVFENSRNSFSRVVNVVAMWMDKDIKVACDIADTDAKKVAGLQSYDRLEDNKGLFFPYEPYTDVTFHQGSVKFPLDLIFIRDNDVIMTVENTKVGSKDKWACEGCTAVLEVTGGFCKKKGIELGDVVVFMANSEKDIEDYRLEKEADLESLRYDMEVI
jgi:uncharacterized membrane protein (UPF0127 family)